MGYWPSKLACILNLIMQIGWRIIGYIIAGQMFSAINGAGLSVAVGYVISAICIGLIATFGISIIHTYERCALYTTLEWKTISLRQARYAFIPQMFAILVLVGFVGKSFDTFAVSISPADTVTANRCSFFALEFASVINFAAIGVDFYVYYSTATSKNKSLS